LMEIYMIKELDKWISSHKEVYVSHTGNEKWVPTGIDGKPHHQSNTPDVNELDDVAPHLVKVISSDLS
jgi:hypothetical protein